MSVSPIEARPQTAAERDPPGGRGGAQPGPGPAVCLRRCVAIMVHGLSPSTVANFYMAGCKVSATGRA